MRSEVSVELLNHLWHPFVETRNEFSVFSASYRETKATFLFLQQGVNYLQSNTGSMWFSTSRSGLLWNVSSALKGYDQL